MARVKKEVENKLRVEEEETLVIGGDMNARIGKEGNMPEEEERRSKDRVTNREGRTMVEWCEERNWKILNGNIEGDKEGGFTYVGGAGVSVIDYGIVNERAWEKTKKFVIGQRVDSDHLPIEVEIEGRMDRNKRGEGKKKKYAVWGEEEVIKFREKEEEGEYEEGGSLEERWRRLKGKCKDCMQWKEWTEKGKSTWGRKGGDNEVKKIKREAKKAYMKWKKGEEKKEIYIERRKVLREKIKEKERKEREKLIAEIEGFNSEREVWEFISKIRKERVARARI